MWEFQEENKRVCQSCGVVILDPMAKCPLCRRGLPTGEAAALDAEPYYPRTRRKTHRSRNALRIYLICVIAAFLVLISVNLHMDHRLWWTVMIGFFMVYGYITLFFSLKKRIDHRAKLMLQSLLAVLLVLFIDYATGMRGWCLNYVYPGLLAFLDLMVVLFMLINKRNWQSYIIMQIWVVVLALVPFVLYAFGLVDRLQVPWIILAVVILVFLATLVIGGRRARSELVRRFHR